MSEQLLLVDPPEHPSRSFGQLQATRVGSAEAIRTALKQVGKRALWIAPNGPAAELLILALDRQPRLSQRLLALGHSDAGRCELMRAHFCDVVSPHEGVRLLPLSELADVLGTPNRADFFIGGVVAPADSAIVLIRGNLDRLVIPVSWFRSRAEGPEPDLTRLTITDHGQTVRLGDYEAATDAVLYEFDERYRQRAKKRQAETDTSFGGALRRLRIQKELRQSDFPGITAKEIARIERGEIKKPHQRTLAVIAKRLGVPAEQIATY
jgi:hypothetical protein